MNDDRQKLDVQMLRFVLRLFLAVAILAIIPEAYRVFRGLDAPYYLVGPVAAIAIVAALLWMGPHIRNRTIIDCSVTDDGIVQTFWGLHSLTRFEDIVEIRLSGFADWKAQLTSGALWINRFATQFVYVRRKKGIALYMSPAYPADFVDQVHRKMVDKGLWSRGT
jgi:hypothetical protein